MKCRCGNNQFYASQVVRVNVIVDEHGFFEENAGETVDASIYEAETPYGPFICTICGNTYDELEDE